MYAIITRNDAVLSRHRTISGAVRTLHASRRAFDRARPKGTTDFYAARYWVVTPSGARPLTEEEAARFTLEEQRQHNAR